MGKKKSKKSAKGASASSHSSRGVVGPDYVQVLSGSIAAKSLRLVLCGESHADAIDVTRRGGGIVKEGWETTDPVELVGEMVGKFGGIDDEGDDDASSRGIRVRVGICKRNNKLLPLGKAKEWGKDVGGVEIDYIPPGREMALLWVPSMDGGGTTRGKSYVVELFLDEGGGSGNDDDEDDEDEDGGRKDRSRAHLPPDVVILLDRMTNATRHMSDVGSLSRVVRDLKDGKIPDFAVDDDSNSHVLFQWADMDDSARRLNHRRLLGEKISNAEHDGLIRDRATTLRSGDDVWTWDDWLTDVKSKLSDCDGDDDAPSLHLVLESPIPPWEVEMCRDSMPEFEHVAAANCVRCLSEDSEYSEMDAKDPASDGIGSYLAYLHRRFMEVERVPNGDGEGVSKSTGFLHCVDCRDLGCDDSIPKDWIGLLEPGEKLKLLGTCVPWGLSPEEVELERLQISGNLMSEHADDDEDGELDDVSNPITFPSMERFFGQCTDIMYYTPNYKIAFAPFLSRCVKSMDRWNSFFAELFFGGTVGRALSMLDLSDSSCLHVRSPIMKILNDETGEYELRKRVEEELDASLPLLPIKAFLKAKGSSPARTWSSNLFATLLECECQELRDMAIHAREWAINDIAKHSDDPKLSDDDIGGGEWFLAYLRQCHREIYDDIDRTDCALLLRKRNAVGEKKKHKIGDIAIPSCSKGFQLINEELLRIDGKAGKPTFSQESEIMAKIMIDISMNKLVDASTLVKIGQLVSKDTAKNIIVVCYMGTVHTRAICEFFTQPQYGFKKKIFCGKQDWGVEEGRILHLPPELWDPKALFNNSKS